MRQVVQEVQEAAPECILKLWLILIPQLLNQQVLNLINRQPLTAMGAILISCVCKCTEAMEAKA
jgi:hypothetical protein